MIHFYDLEKSQQELQKVQTDTIAVAITGAVMNVLFMAMRKRWIWDFQNEMTIALLILLFIHNLILYLLLIMFREEENRIKFRIKQLNEKYKMEKGEMK